jgi:hypothetical protein
MGFHQTTQWCHAVAKACKGMQRQRHVKAKACKGKGMQRQRHAKAWEGMRHVYGAMIQKNAISLVGFCCQ